MPNIETIGSEVASEIKNHRAEYIEIHLEESYTSNVSYRGRILETVGKGSSVGGNVRALVKGGWGFTSFNNLDHLAERIDQAILQASLVKSEPRQLAETPVVNDRIMLDEEHNPVAIPLSCKKDLVERYNDLIWQTPKLQTSVLRYADSRRKQIFISSEGSYIEQERADITLGMAAIASNGQEVQQSNLSLGNPGIFARVEHLDEEISEAAARASALLEAPNVEGGEYTVILDPVLAGVFVHEAFGHLSEADFVFENEPLRNLMVMGKRFGGTHLNIVDGAAVPGLRGSYCYDDEGVASSKTYLITEGVLTGRLHSRETAARMGEKPTGNARAVNYHHSPIVRMTNTFIEPGGTRFEDMLAGIKQGVYARNWYGGTTSMEMFTFSAGEAYMIRDGKIAELLRPVVLTGNVFTTLANIDAIGDDLQMNEGGGCGKNGQFPLPVSNGSPHIRIQKCLVGGA